MKQLQRKNFWNISDSSLLINNIKNFIVAIKKIQNGRKKIIFTILTVKNEAIDCKVLN